MTKEKEAKSLWVKKNVVTLHPLFGVTADYGRVAGHVALERQTIFNYQLQWI